MDSRKDLLVATGARLYSLGLDLEMARDELKQLVKQGISYNSEEMRKTYEEVEELDRQWKSLEKQYLALRAEILND